MARAWRGVGRRLPVLPSASNRTMSLPSTFVTNPAPPAGYTRRPEADGSCADRLPRALDSWIARRLGACESTPAATALQRAAASPAHMPVLVLQRQGMGVLGLVRGMAHAAIGRPPVELLLPNDPADFGEVYAATDAPWDPTHLRRPVGPHTPETPHGTPHT